MKKILLVILIFSLSLFSLLIAVESNAFDESHFGRNIYDNNIEEITGKDYFELKNIYRHLTIYLKGKAGNEILERDFNEREILHMVDVQELFRIGFILKYISLIASLGIIIYFFRTKEFEILGRFILKGMFINWALLGLLVLMIYFDFNKYFTYFHHIFFTNDLWLLDPDTDLLIQMLPENFFSSIAMNIGVSFFRNVAIIQGIGYAIIKKGRSLDENKLGEDKE